MDAAQAKFEGWAVIELFGHQREAGFVTTQYFGNAAMFQLDVPELPEREYTLERPDWSTGELLPAGSVVKKEAIPARSRLINPSAVYALNPCEEDAAKKAIENLQAREFKVIKLAENKQLATVLPYEDLSEEEQEAADRMEHERSI